MRFRGAERAAKPAPGRRVIKKTWFVLALLVAFPATSPAFDLLSDYYESGFYEGAEGAPVAATVDLYALAEHHAWKEVSGGFRTSEEDGELYGAGAAAAFESGASVWRLKGEYFQGTVDAKGVSSGVAWTTDADVAGFRAEGDLGRRFRAGAASFVPNVGFGYRWWRRDYASSATVIGLKEEWQTGNVKVGAVAQYEAGRAVTLFLEAAGRLGVFASNRITFNGARVTMKPGGRVTPYAEAGLAAGFLKGSVYYERIAFSESDPVSAPGLPPGTGLVQPETTADIYGARIGLSF